MTNHILINLLYTLDYSFQSSDVPKAMTYSKVVVAIRFFNFDELVLGHFV